MNTEQLHAARLARWSQDGEARLTLEAATEWLGTIGFCPYLPAGLAGAAPSPSFLEAVVGRPAPVPSAGERSRAKELLARLVANAAGVPLKLGSSLGEEPDFVASPEALRYLYALRGDRNAKSAPSTTGNRKVTPLALDCWAAIQQQGPLDVFALQPILGRDITEAAIARALQELWSGLYVFPIPSVSGKPAQWELLARGFPAQVAAGATTGQAESQSALISLYLYTAVAATEEEVLSFLSPLAAKSKLREVIHGLGSMRQLDIVDIGGRAHVCLQGGLLPEMVAQLTEEQLGTSRAESESEPEIAREAAAEQAAAAGIFAGGIAMEREPARLAGGEADNAKKFVPKKFVPKKFVPRNTGTEEFSGKRSWHRPASRTSGGRPGADGARRRQENNFKRSNFGSAGSNRRESDARGAFAHGPGERARRWEKSEAGRERGAVPRRGPGGKPRFESSGFKPGGFKPGGVKPWTRRGFQDSGSFKSGTSPRGEGRKRWEKPGQGFMSSMDRGAEAHAGERTRAGFGSRPEGQKPRGQKPWGSKSFGRKPSEFNSSGSKSVSAKRAKGKPFGSKPWVSKGAESRVGSARAYAARTSHAAGGSAPDISAPNAVAARRPDKRFGKARGPKTWTKKVSSQRDGSARGDAGGKPQRRERPDSAGGMEAGEKRNARPFWAKNPRGGKGSVAASRTNRPRGGKKAGGKKSGKRK